MIPHVNYSPPIAGTELMHFEFSIKFQGEGTGVIAMRLFSVYLNKKITHVQRKYTVDLSRSDFQILTKHVFTMCTKNKSEAIGENNNLGYFAIK